jgi:hypothetical protein
MRFEKAPIGTLEGKDPTPFYPRRERPSFNEEMRRGGKRVASFETPHQLREDLFAFSHDPKIDI